MHRILIGDLRWGGDEFERLGSIRGSRPSKRERDWPSPTECARADLEHDRRLMALEFVAVDHVHPTSNEFDWKTGLFVN